MSVVESTHRFLETAAITDSDLRAYRAREHAHSIHSILDYHADVLRLLHGGREQGDTLPWPKTHSRFRFRPGEVTLWHGFNGHAKSAVTSQVALWLAIHNAKCCLASFEMLPERTLQRMATQAAGNPNPSDEVVNEFFVGLCRRLWVYDHRGRVDHDLLFSAIRFAAEVKGTSHFFVDSLMKCVPREDDYNGQSDFINAICDVAHETATHIHIVHHEKKPTGGEGQKPEKYNARGAGAISDQVDNVIGVWRNKAKERKREQAEQVGAPFNDEEEPDFMLFCDKQRNGGWEGVWGLWGDVKTFHFRESAKRGWERGYKMPGYDRGALTQEEPGAEG